MYPVEGRTYYILEGGKWFESIKSPLSSYHNKLMSWIHTPFFVDLSGNEEKFSEKGYKLYTVYTVLMFCKSRIFLWTCSKTGCVTFVCVRWLLWGETKYFLHKNIVPWGKVNYYSYLWNSPLGSSHSEVSVFEIM